MFLTAEKKTHTKVYLTWDAAEENAKYSIYRQLTDGGEFKKIASTYSTIYIDSSELIRVNEFIVYKVTTEKETSNKARVEEDADPQVYEAADTYIWTLKEGGGGVRATAYCKAKNMTPCPECWSVPLKKRIKAKCSTCDGSGMIKAYSDPIEFYLKIVNKSDAINNIGNSKERNISLLVRTGNIPMFKEGDIVEIGYERYVVNNVPRYTTMVSLNNRKMFITKQELLLVLAERGNEIYTVGMSI